MNAATNVRIYTGATDTTTTGTERLRITSSGNVGIGVTDPDQALEVTGNVKLTTFSDDFQFGSASNQLSYNLYLSSASGGTTMQNTTGDLLFVADNVTTMTMDNGNVGIGTTSPDQLLTISKAGSAGGLSIERTDGSPSVFTLLNIGGQMFFDYVGGANGYVFQVEGDSKMIIAESGDVGIGTTSPKSSLHIAVTGNDWEDGLLLEHDEGGTGWNIHPESDANDSLWFGYNSDTNLDLASQSATAVLVIDGANKRVGIGVTDPDHTLEVAGTGGAPGINITNSNSRLYFDGARALEGGSYLAIGEGFADVIFRNSEQVGVGSTSPWAQLSINPDGESGPSFAIGSSTATDFIVDNGGNVGIGTASPGSPLDLHSTSAAGLNYVRSGTSIGSLTASNNDFEVLALTNNLILGANAAKYIAFKDGSTENMRIDANGNVGIGTTSPQALLHLGDGSGNVELTVESSTKNRAFIGVFGDNAGFSVNRSVVDGAFTNPSLTHAEVSLRSNNGDSNIGFFTTDTNNVIGTERMTIDKDGNVGIGTVSPNAQFHNADGTTILGSDTWPTSAVGKSGDRVLVASDSEDARIIVFNGKTPVAVDTGGLIQLGGLATSGGTDFAGGSIFAGKEVVTSGSLLGYLTLQTTASGGGLVEHLRIDSSGNVGVGTTSPYAKLSVAGFINTDQYSGFKQAGVTILHASSTNFSTFVGGYAGASILAGGTNNLAVGYQAGNALTTGDNNVFLGYQSGDGATASSRSVGIGSGVLGSASYAPSAGADGGTPANIAIGYLAGSVITTGTGNTAIGQNALNANTTSAYNIALGDDALGSLSTASHRNIGIGNWAGLNLTAAGDNVLIGHHAAAGAALGSQNIAIGTDALGGPSNTAAANIAIGYQSLDANSTGVRNTGIGHQTLSAITINNDSTAVGFNALLLDTGGSNTALGSYALDATAAGTDNIGIGLNAGGANSGGSRNISIGTSANNANTATNDSIGIGYNALLLEASGGINLAIGSYALDAANGAERNVALGWSTLSAITTADDSTAVGYGALKLDTGGSNTAVGSQALDANTSGTRNTGLGYQALSAISTTNDSTAVGHNALLVDIGGINTAIGSGALDANTTGTENVAVGYNALTSNISGYDNVAIGTRALQLIQNGSVLNVALGADALAGLNNATADNNIGLGYAAGDNITSGAHNLIIGHNIDAPSATASNQLNIGNIIFGLNVDSSGTTVDTDALIGIGTAGPQGRLHVYTGSAGTVAVDSSSDEFIIEGSGHTGMTLYSPDVNATAIVFANASDDVAAKIQYDGNANELLISTQNASDYLKFSVADGAEAMRIDTAGNIGIGEASPDAELHISGNGPDIHIQDTTNSGDAAVSYIEGFDSGDTRRWIIGDRSASNDDVGITADTGMLYFTAGADIVGIANNGIDIAATGLDQLVVGDSIDSQGIVIDAGAGDDAALAFSEGGTALGRIIWEGSDNSLRLEVSALGTANLTIDSSGNVGIGTSTPLGKLMIKQNSADAYGMVIEASANDRWLRIGHDGTNAQIHTTYNSAAGTGGQLRLGVHSAQSALTIETDGKVGIGTTTPGAELDIRGGTGLSKATLRIGGGNGSLYGEIGDLEFFEQHYAGVAVARVVGHRGSSGNNGALSFETAISGSLVSRMRIDQNGNVGIGTSTPSAPLNVHVSATAGGSEPIEVLRLSMDDADSADMAIGMGPKMTFYLPDNNVVTSFEGASIAAEKEVGDDSIQDIALTFSTIANGGSITERLRIASSGNVGIGTEAPSPGGVFGLHIKDASHTGLEIESGSATDAFIVLDENGADEVKFGWDASGNTFEIGVSSADFSANDFVINESGSVGIGISSIGSAEMKLSIVEHKLLGVGTEGSSLGYAGGISMLGSGNNSADGSYFGWIGQNLRWDGSNFLRATDEGSTNWGNIAGMRLQRGAVGTDDVIQFITDIPNEAGSGEQTIGTSIDSLIKMVITNAGNVGIGNTAPGELLEISEVSGAARLEISTWDTNDGTNSSLHFQKSNNTTVNTLSATAADENLGLITGQGVTTGSAARIAAEILFEGDAAPDGDSVPGRIIFSTSDLDDAGVPTERMRIDDAGNVGIGDLAPATKFEVNAGGATSIEIIRASIDAHSAGLGVDHNGTYWGTEIFQDGTVRMILESNGGVLIGGSYMGNDAPANGLLVEGEVGIGTVSPDHFSWGNKSLSLVGSGTNQNTNIDIVGTGTGAAALIFGGGTTSGTVDNIGRASITGIDGSHLTFNTNSSDSGSSFTERMRIESGGNVGIGVADPDEALEIVGNLRLGDGTDQGRIYFRNDYDLVSIYEASYLLNIDSANGITLDFDSNGNDGGVFRIDESGTARFYIADDGNVGIGTTAPGTRLSLAGVGITNGFTIGSGSTTAMTLFNDARTIRGHTETKSPHLDYITTDNSNGGTDDWITPEEVVQRDDVFASQNLTEFDIGDLTFWLRAEGFDFDIPDDAVINGIEVFIEADDNGGSNENAFLEDVQIIKGGTITGDDQVPVHFGVDRWSETFKLGSPDNLWGTTWSVSDINGVKDFGVAVAFTALNNNAEITIDYIGMKVYYSVPIAETHFYTTGSSPALTFSNENATGTIAFLQQPFAISKVPYTIGTSTNGSGETNWTNFFETDGAVYTEGTKGWNTLLYKDGLAVEYTTTQFDSPDTTNWLMLTNFNFEIPPDVDTITGIEVIITANDGSDSSDSAFVDIKLIDNGVVSGTDLETGTTALRATDYEFRYGSTTEQWGLTLTPADIMDSDFGVALSFQAIDANADIYIDQVQIIAHYNALVPNMSALNVNGRLSISDNLRVGEILLQDIRYTDTSQNDFPTKTGESRLSIEGGLNVQGGMQIEGYVVLTLDDGTATEGVCHSGSDSTVTDVHLIDCSGTPAADYAEMYPVALDVEVGDIVALGTTTVITKTGNSITQLVKATTPYQATAIGIVSDPEDAGDFNSIGYNIEDEDNPMPVALMGRVPVKVSMENGAIEVGDDITTSSVAGVGMKSTQSGITVGTAIESFSTTTPGAIGTVMVFTQRKSGIIRDKFVIDDSGNVGIGTTSPDYKLHVIGDVAATSFVNISTKTAKKDIEYLEDADTETILSKIRNVGVATYRYNHEDDNAPVRLGLIAEEAPVEVLSADGKGVDIYKLSTFILAGVQDLSSQVESLDERLTALEAKVASSDTGTSTTDTSGIIDLISSKLVDLGFIITDGLTRIKNLAVENFWAETIIVDNITAQALTIGTAENQSGITLFDEVTGDPYCFSVANGSVVTVAGKCSEGVSLVDAVFATTTVEVINEEAPVITLNGNNPATLNINSTYMDLGAVITDNNNNNLGYKVFLDGVSVGNISLDTSAPREYSIDYVATDQEGNTATTTRLVYIVDPNPSENTEEETATTTPELIIEDVVEEEEVATSTPEIIVVEEEATPEDGQVATTTPEVILDPIVEEAAATTPEVIIEEGNPPAGGATSTPELIVEDIVEEKTATSTEPVL
ncbi:hypothetical protein COB55_02870 [Candidatus Wolfebacteria bacterium]|nr:MAG: hypothetical protein COB55_02870 [Candidatus Wolfebacteria bacterium]